MKFTVRRTSTILSGNKPCPEARKAACKRVEIRTLPSAAAFDKKFGDREGPWLSKGENHRKIGRDIARDWDDEHWVVEIDSLDDLLEFTDKYGEIILGRSWRNTDYRGIEIYDDYRE